MFEARDEHNLLLIQLEGFEGLVNLPLKRIRNPVTPLIISRKHRSNNSNSNDLSQTPAEIDICRQVSTKSNRAHLGSVSNRKCLENSPWDTTENLGNQEMYNRLSGEEDCGEPSDQ